MIMGGVTLAVLASDRVPSGRRLAPRIPWRRLGDAAVAAVPTSDADREKLRRALREFHDKHAGTRQGEEAAVAARKLPSALDRIRALRLGNTRGLVAMFDAHECPVYGVGVSPDGTMLATSGSSDPVIKLWELRGGKYQLREKLSGHQAGVHSVRFAPDGRSLISTSFDQTAQSMGPERTPARRGMSFAMFPVASRPPSIHSMVARCSPAVRMAARHVFPISKATIGSGEELPGKVPGTEILAFNRDATLLAVAGGNVRLWALTGEGRQERGSFQGSSNFFSLGFSPDSRLLAAGGTDGGVTVWDLSRPLGAAARPSGDTRGR